MSARPRVIIADDHTFVAELCQRFLEPEFDVVRIVTNGRDLVSATTDMKPDVILVDIAMPVMNGFEAATQIKDVLRKVKVIYLTMNSDPQMAMHAFDKRSIGVCPENLCRFRAITCNPIRRAGPHMDISGSRGSDQASTFGACNARTRSRPPNTTAT
jgi:CheY-like chemotaxis protein